MPLICLTDVFNKFKAEDGSFIKDITNEPRALLGLYNAAYLSIHGESQLDEAIAFARHHLESMRGSLKYPLSEQIKRNLEIPYPRALKRINAPYYIAEYEQERTCIPSLLELAKLDFNLLQRLHQRELKDFCRWGNNLYEEVQLSYSRNRIVECYFWSNIMQYEEQYGHARIILAKVFVLLTLLDDTFDMHATLEEGRKLNEAIQRWEESAVLLLPEYLKKYYVRLMNTFTEIELELKPDHNYRVAYSRKALQTLCRHYQQESEWFHSSYIPSFDDHLKCSLISSGIPMLSISSIVGMGDEATKEAFEWAGGCTDAVQACTVVGRLMNDITSFKRGKNKLDVASSVDSYINQYHVTSEVALATLDNLVQDAWKTSNQARFHHHALLPLVKRIIRLTKSMTLMYHDNVDRNSSSRGNKDKIEQQFVEAIPL
ncbi:tau-cadinol synthase-like [Aegilops tauschii subsp. strangulata]|uniref:tau-cadinol synthase-like n=1 Tax=Aegilops tauschii subsp. strangulata TaxID=200361 RepID=UPI00098B4C0C